jgi:hypothetical protein
LPQAAALTALGPAASGWVCFKTGQDFSRAGSDGAICFTQNGWWKNPDVESKHVTKTHIWLFQVDLPAKIHTSLLAMAKSSISIRHAQIKSS